IRKQETGDFQPPPRCLVLATPAATIRTPKTTEDPLLGVAGTSSRIFGLKVSGRGVEDMRRLRSCANQGFETKHEARRSKDEKAVPEKSRTHTLLECFVLCRPSPGPRAGFARSDNEGGRSDFRAPLCGVSRQS